MNNFCIDLKFKFNPLCNEFSLDNLKNTNKSKLKHCKLNLQTDINQEFLKFLDQRNLHIILAETFYISKFGRIPIHSDGINCNDYTKLNWVYGGNKSRMIWYKSKEGAIPKLNVNDIGVTYEHYKQSDVEIIHSQSVGFPSLVQVAGPHSVQAHAEERLCISIIIAYKNTSITPTFVEALEIFKEYIE
jgi:hypothetical protein